jgi:demethylmenaquinone methyltransferase/2-methoxy-6-polyprenyl-1,4-benzoquinol methylase
MFYLKQVVPVIGKLLLANPNNYRLLGVYTQQFNNCSRIAQHLRAAGLHVEYRSFFIGCASGVRGRKPSET